MSLFPHSQDEGHFTEAEGAFVQAGRSKEAIDMYVHQRDWAARGLPVAKGHTCPRKENQGGLFPRQFFQGKRQDQPLPLAKHLDCPEDNFFPSPLVWTIHLAQSHFHLYSRSLPCGNVVPFFPPAFFPEWRTFGHVALPFRKAPHTTPFGSPTSTIPHPYPTCSWPRPARFRIRWHWHVPFLINRVI